MVSSRDYVLMSFCINKFVNCIIVLCCVRINAGNDISSFIRTKLNAVLAGARGIGVIAGAIWMVRFPASLGLPLTISVDIGHSGLAYQRPRKLFLAVLHLGLRGRDLKMLVRSTLSFYYRPLKYESCGVTAGDAVGTVVFIGQIFTNAFSSFETLP
jgi:hypothetical protein